METASGPIVKVSLHLPRTTWKAVKQRALDQDTTIRVTVVEILERGLGAPAATEKRKKGVAA